MPRGRSVFAGRESGPIADLFIAVAFLGIGIATVLVLVAAVGGDDSNREELAPSGADDTTPRIRAILAQRSGLALAWREALREICESAELQAEGLAPSCQTGAITIGDELFEQGSAQLSEEGMRKVQVAVPIVLAALRARDEVWAQLESIEVRGHSDPRARRDPYSTNLVGSQQRPLSVMLYLSSEWALTEADRRDLQRFALVSASSFVRAPQTCAERKRECYPFWRRVEVIPHIRETELSDDMRALVERIEPLLPGDAGV